MANKTVGRMWVVMPLDVGSDPNKVVLNGADVNGRGIRNFGLEEAQPAPAPRRNEARAQVRQQEAPLEVDDPGYGFFLDSKSRVEVVVFTSQAKAETYAESQAALKPTRLYGVFHCGNIFETAQPTIIVKNYNDAGELVLKNTPKAETTTAEPL